MRGGARNTKHGDSRKGERLPLYGVWSTMRSRCANPKARGYPNYGARGITVCPEWLDYRTFKLWAEESGYAPGLQIDRNDNNAGYNPANCRWVTRKQNQRNKRLNHKVTAFDETKPLVDWAEDPRCVVAYGTLKKRIYRGLRPETALTCRSIPAGKYARERSARYTQCACI